MIFERTAWCCVFDLVVRKCTRRKKVTKKFFGAVFYEETIILEGELEPQMYLRVWQRFWEMCLFLILKWLLLTLVKFASILFLRPKSNGSNDEENRGSLSKESEDAPPETGASTTHRDQGTQTENDPEIKPSNDISEEVYEVPTLTTNRHQGTQTEEEEEEVDKGEDDKMTEIKQNFEALLHAVHQAENFVAYGFDDDYGGGGDNYSGNNMDDYHGDNDDDDDDDSFLNRIE